MQALSLAERIFSAAVPVVFAITVHEVAHGWVAARLGDPTAKLAGRLTLNPVKHNGFSNQLCCPFRVFSLTFRGIDPMYLEISFKSLNAFFINILDLLENGWIHN